jgi:hypothetical protein
LLNIVRRFLLGEFCPRLASSTHSFGTGTWQILNEFLVAR